MEKIEKVIKAFSGNAKVLIDGAPVNTDFCEKNGAGCYSPNPQGAVAYLNSVVKKIFPISIIRINKTKKDSKVK
ncbi:MAG: hypothetical protein HQ522_14385 [Bacteroidetes bacterium]|nr:hypothetical protein [Bacteroidota bacterium]